MNMKVVFTCILTLAASVAFSADKKDRSPAQTTPTQGTFYCSNVSNLTDKNAGTFVNPEAAAKAMNEICDNSKSFQVERLRNDYYYYCCIVR